MNGNLNSAKSIYLQIAEMLEDNILRDILMEEEQVPSTNELARTFSINPATAAKGINILVEEGTIYKRRGIGMFVAGGAKAKIIEKRKTSFFEEYIKSLVREAKGLKISKTELVDMIDKAITEEK
ncbi:MAG: GntR family transcriptional regulator [Oscillospiraceae bacterium]